MLKKENIKLIKLYIYIIFRFFPIIDYYKILTIIPCDMHRYLLFIYFIYSRMSLLIPISDLSLIYLF